MVCIKIKSTPASLPFESQVTEHTVALEKAVVVEGCVGCRLKTVIFSFLFTLPYNLVALLRD